MKIKYRVKTNQDFQKIIRDNKKVSNLTYVLYYKKNELDHPRFGISTSKKLGNAVVRNKIRRQVRVMCRDILKFNKNIDYIIIVRKEYVNATYQKNYDELMKLINKLKED